MQPSIIMLVFLSQVILLFHLRRHIYTQKLYLCESNCHCVCIFQRISWILYNSFFNFYSPMFWQGKHMVNFIVSFYCLYKYMPPWKSLTYVVGISKENNHFCCNELFNSVSSSWFLVLLLPCKSKNFSHSLS